MKICVKEILNQGLDIEQELDPYALGLETPQIHYRSGIKVKARLEREKDIVYARVFIRSRKSMICSRCFERFDSVFEQESDFIYKPGNEHTIDLTDDIRDTVILGYPIRQLCKDDCKGLCLICGVNLNQGVCRCER
jgi:uncharacterized protein